MDTPHDALDGTDAELLRELRAWKQMKRREILAVLRLAGDAVVGGVEEDEEKGEGKGGCGGGKRCGGGKKCGCQGGGGRAAKMIDPDGRPVEGDDPGERDWGTEDEQEDEDRYIDMENVRYVQGLEPRYYGSEYDKCQRFEPPDRECTDPISDIIVSAHVVLE